MNELEQYFCPNEQCKDYGCDVRSTSAFAASMAREKSRELLYCRTCGKRFAATQGNALFGLHLPAETIRQIFTTWPSRGLAYEPLHACWSLKEHSQPGDPAGRRALRPCTRQPVDITTSGMRWKKC